MCVFDCVCCERGRLSKYWFMRVKIKCRAFKARSEVALDCRCARLLTRRVRRASEALEYLASSTSSTSVDLLGSLTPLPSPHLRPPLTFPTLVSLKHHMHVLLNLFTAKFSCSTFSVTLSFDLVQGHCGPSLYSLS